MAEPRLSASEALYNFRLLAALRSDDLSAVQPFLLELAQGDDKTRVDREGQLLGMAIKVASGKLNHVPRSQVANESARIAPHLDFLEHLFSQRTYRPWLKHHCPSCS